MIDVQTPSFFRILQRQNDTPGPITDTVAFTLTVTGPNIQETIGVILVWNDTEGNPAVTMSTSTSGAGSADGLRYLRLVYPKRTGSGEPWRVDAAASDGTKRSISIDVTTSSPYVSFESSLVIPDWEADYNTTVLQIPEPAAGGGGGGDEYVPLTRMVNGKSLATDISLDASDVGALPSSTAIPSKTSDLTNDSGFISQETDPTVPAWAKAAQKPTYTASEVGALPDSTTIPSKTSDLTNDSGFISTETDPTVPSWAKQSTKPTYTASEVGALPASTPIPSKTSDLTNDSGFITTETDPTVPSWAKASSKPSYTASEVGAVGTSGDASSTTVAFTQASTRTNIATGGTLATAFGRISKWLADLGSLAFKSTVSKSDLASGVQDSLDLADTALQSFTETDPTVPSWAKASSKPTYTYSEVGAAASSHSHSEYLEKSGGTMTGALTLSADPTSNLEAATKQYVDNHSGGGGGGILYGECSTSASTQTKAVTVDSSFVLESGAAVLVKFTNAQSYSGQPKLNVNDTGAKGIVSRGTTAGVVYQWLAGESILFVYDGTNWAEVNGGIASTTYYGVTKLSSSTTSTSTALAATASAVKAVNDRITYGSTDLTAGTSALTTGVYYAYYEL